jgi:hypothetical protein
LRENEEVVSSGKFFFIGQRYTDESAFLVRNSTEAERISIARSAILGVRSLP